MTWKIFDLSKAARRCRQVAEDYGWDVTEVGYDAASFNRGDRYLLIFISINGGLTLVRTDQGDYRGANRVTWASTYLREHGERQ